MRNPYVSRFPSRLTVYFYIVIVFPVVWSLFSAVWSATTTGTVTVISVGRYSTQHEVVHWVEGWARFAGPIFLLTSLWLWKSAYKRSLSMWLLAAGLLVLGIVLLLWSWWFVSIDRLIFLIGFASLVTTALLIGNRYGALAVVLLVGAAFGLLIWVDLR